jgi:hypothetical protein
MQNAFFGLTSLRAIFLRRIIISNRLMDSSDADPFIELKFLYRFKSFLADLSMNAVRFVWLCLHQEATLEKMPGSETALHSSFMTQIASEACVIDRVKI